MRHSRAELPMVHALVSDYPLEWAALRFHQLSQVSLSLRRKQADYKVQDARGYKYMHTYIRAWKSWCLILSSRIAFEILPQVC